jgi:glycosyltransferase involved in cell wall biosynthesis
MHCPDNVAGHPAALAAAERALGLDSAAVSLTASPFDFPADEVLWQRPDALVRNEAARWRLLWRALTRVDVVHFNFGQSIMPPWHGHRDRSGLRPRAYLRRAVADSYKRALWLRDLPLLRAAGKGIVVTYQGNDARQGDWCRRNQAVTAATHLDDDFYRDDPLKRTAIERFARYSHATFSLNPDLLHVLPPQARFLPYASVDPRLWRPERVALDHHTPVVLHAPTNRAVKGTTYVVEAVRRLHREGVDFEFLLVEGLSHREARRLYRRADLLVDQLLVGWYGGLAVELMALGKPVVCYLRDADLGFLPAGMRGELPIIQASPDCIEAVLREWLTIRRGELPVVGLRSRSYVERWHDPLVIAARLKETYERVAADIRGEG